jgi:hypothetical protein
LEFIEAEGCGTFVMREEYIAGNGAMCQAVWLRCLMEEVLGKKMVASRIKLDNQSAIALGKNLVLHDRIKHVKTKYHFIRECVKLGETSLEFLGTHDQLTDLDEATCKGEISRTPREDWSGEVIIVQETELEGVC